MVRSFFTGHPTISDKGMIYPCRNFDDILFSPLFIISYFFRHWSHVPYQTKWECNVLYPTGMYYIRHCMYYIRHCMYYIRQACTISDMHVLYPTCIYFIRQVCIISDIAYIISDMASIISDMASIISDMLCNCILYQLTLHSFFLIRTLAIRTSGWNWGKN